MFKVCIIEDEIIIRQGLIQSINWSELDCVVVAEANNGVEGIKVIEKHLPDIIIMDINMPVMDGLTMLTSLPSYMYSTIIISGHSEFEYAQKAIKLGVTEYLLKPLDHQELIEAIKRAQEDLLMRRLYLEKVTTTKDEDKFFIMNRNIQVSSFSLMKAIEFISENFHNKITMKDLVEATGKSSTFLNLRFQKELNMSFLEFLTNYRIQSAIDLMKERKLQLYEIAQAVGFNEYKYFNQVFKKVVSVPPKIVQSYYVRMKGKQND